MAPTAFSGSLQPKKKAELQEICVALSLSDQGTKEEMHGRIKKYLDSNQATLEEDPAFMGLFGRRKRQGSVPPGRFAPSEPLPEESSARASRRVVPLGPIGESTPNTPSRKLIGTPSSLPPLPDTPDKSFLSISRRDVEVVLSLVKSKEEVAVKNASEMLVHVRGFLSSSRNIWSLTALLELLFILYTLIPWQSVQFPQDKYTYPTLTLYYPPVATFQKPAFWAVLLHWALPTLLIPALFGTLISFSQPSSSSRSMPLDPLTAAIIRLAAQIAYPYTRLNESTVKGIDVLGPGVRVLDAGVGVAFAFAEAITGPPGRIVKAVEEIEEVE